MTSIRVIHTRATPTMRSTSLAGMPPFSRTTCMTPSRAPSPAGEMTATSPARNDPVHAAIYETSGALEVGSSAFPREDSATPHSTQLMTDVQTSAHAVAGVIVSML